MSSFTPHSNGRLNLLNQNIAKGAKDKDLSTLCRVAHNHNAEVLLIQEPPRNRPMSATSPYTRTFHSPWLWYQPEDYLNTAIIIQQGSPHTFLPRYCEREEGAYEIMAIITNTSTDTTLGPAAR